MTMRVVVLQGAELDLRELRRYLCHRFGTKRWTDTLQSIRSALLHIAEHPQSGHVPDELVTVQLVQYRQVLSGKNRIVYELRGPVVYVHLVCDTRRDLKTVLMRRLLESP